MSNGGSRICPLPAAMLAKTNILSYPPSIIPNGSKIKLTPAPHFSAVTLFVCVIQGKAIKSSERRKAKKRKYAISFNRPIKKQNNAQCKHVLRPSRIRK